MTNVRALVAAGRRFLRRPFRHTWQHRSMRVTYLDSLDGGGRVVANHFFQLIKRTLGSQAPVEKAFEWCSGPGFLGFGLLAEGLATRVCFADINPRAIECVARTARRNGVSDRVTHYVSDNLAQVPELERFNLVVGNPPSYCGINPKHPWYARVREDLRANDPGWRIHAAFFASIRAHLEPGAMLFIDEARVADTEVYTHNYVEPYDIRPCPPIDDFRRMIDTAGLELIAVEPLMIFPGGVPIEVLVIRNPA